MAVMWKRVGTGFFFLLISGLLCTIIYLAVLLQENRGMAVTLTGISALLASSSATACAVYFFSGSRNKSNKEEERLTALIKEVASCAEEDRSKGILELMLANTNEIRKFYSISQLQAKNIFYIASTMIVSGAVLLIISICALLILNDHSETFSISIIVGGIVEFLGGTIFKVYRKTLDQMNHYYRSLHENERYLSILHLAEGMSRDAKMEIYKDIIHSQLPYVNQENWMNMPGNSG